MERDEKTRALALHEPFLNVADVPPAPSPRYHVGMLVHSFWGAVRQQEQEGFFWKARFVGSRGRGSGSGLGGRGRLRITVGSAEAGRHRHASEK